MVEPLSVLCNSLEITNMHVQGMSWIFVKEYLNLNLPGSFEHVSTITGLDCVTKT